MSDDDLQAPALPLEALREAVVDLTRSSLALKTDILSEVFRKKLETQFGCNLQDKMILILIAIASTFASEFEQSLKVKTQALAVADAVAGVDDDSDNNEQNAKRPRHDQHESQLSLPVPVTMVRPTTRIEFSV